MKIRYGGWIIFIILGLAVVINRNSQNMKIKQVVNQDLIQDNYYKEYEGQCYNFIQKYLITSDGSIEETYQMSKKEDIQQPTITIETQNLYLLYLLNKNKKEEFEKTFKYIKKNFIRQEGIVLDRMCNGERLGSSTIGDALDLIKICMLAYDKWGEARYREVALTIEASIYKYGIKDYRLYDSYIDTIEAKEKINLMQVDLNTIRALAHYRAEWKKVYENMYIMIESTYISDIFPFYKTTYYASQELLEQEQQQIDMEKTLSIVLHLAQVNAHKPHTIEWLKEQLKADGLFASYDTKTGLAITQDKNVEDYALIAQIGKCVGDIELYTLAIEQMLTFQVRDIQLNYRGAFIMEEKEVLASENIQCLLGF